MKRKWKHILLSVCMTGALVWGQEGEKLLTSAESSVQERQEKETSQKKVKKSKKNAELELDMGMSLDPESEIDLELEPETETDQGMDLELESGTETDLEMNLEPDSEAETDLELESETELESEMQEEFEKTPADTETEALKAQAVLVRTQISRALQRSTQAEETENQKSDRTGNVSDVILEIDYLSQKEMQDQWPADEYKKRYEKYRNAIESTENEVLFYNDTYAWTPFHQSNTGMSRSAEEVLGSSEFPYIKVNESPADKESEEQVGVFTISYDQIQKKCHHFLAAETDGEKAAAGYSFKDFEILEHDSAGYVGKLRIGETICTGDQFRDALSLPSSSFSFAESGKKIKIITAGNGHGMGLSCWTANKMAKDGKTYKEILEFFYEGTKTEKDLNFIAKNK